MRTLHMSTTLDDLTAARADKACLQQIPIPRVDTETSNRLSVPMKWNCERDILTPHCFP